MAQLISRFTRSAQGAEAVYARILDGEHLWLAVRGEGPLLLRSDGRADVEVPTEMRDDLLVAVFALSETMADLGDDVPVVLMAGSGRKAVPVRHGAPGGDPSVTHDGRADLVVEAVDGVVVVRRHLMRGVEAYEFASTDDGVSLALATSAASVALVAKDLVLVELPVVDGRLVLGTLAGLPPGTTATLRAGQAPVVRRDNVLARPNYAVLLPPMLEPDVELRWLKDGRLAVHRSDRSDQGGS